MEFNNKTCSKCGWETFSFISFDYKYCPMCGANLRKGLSQVTDGDILKRKI